MEYDLLVKATFPNGTKRMLGIAEGKIVKVGEELKGEAKELLDASELTLYPGWIDAHVHFNEPGRANWEGLATGSQALAAGGGTCFFDMPLNSSPPVLDRQSLEEKARLGEAKSCLDFALWGGLTPPSLDSIEEMAEAGAIGFKAFMCPSGLDEFPAADATTLKTGMQKAQALGLPVAVHAELPQNTLKANKESHPVKPWYASRPKEMELNAIRLATQLAGETGCALHIVHVSTPAGIEIVTQAKRNGVDVTVETCPHYLLLDEEAGIEIGAFAKCAPPLRNKAELEGLWACLQRGEIDTIGSDHSPSPPEMKKGDFSKIWGGIAGIQHGLPLLFERNINLESLISQNVAKRFRLPQKGGLEVGKDADFTLVEQKSEVITQESLKTRHAISPYLGKVSCHRIKATYLRGMPVTSESRGKFLKPAL